MARRRSRRSRAAQAQQNTRAVDFSEEYHYVIADLKRFAATAAAMFVLLAVLALVL